MKKMILLFLLTALLPMGVSAYDAYINGIYYNFSGDEAYVTYNKKNPDRNVSDYSGTVVIPETVTHRGQTYTVTGIGKDAFINCSDLTSVTIPESVTSIGNLAFAFCHGLTSITIPSSVTTLGDFAFQGCDNLSSFIIPNSVTYIGRNAFNQCSGMKSITFSNGVPTIGDDAFSSCYGLEKVIVPDLAAWCSISFSLFEANPLCYAHHLYSDETTEITDLTIPDGVSIKQYAFCHCSGLTSVTIPESVTTIGGSAFNGCDGLTSVSISNNVTVIGGGAFAYCTSLPSVTIPESVITIGGGAFYDCTGLTSVVIPNSVKFIGDRAFYDCSGLTSLIIGSGVTSIANDAFYGCYFTTDFVNNSALISSNNWGATLCDEETSDGLLIKGDTVVRCRPWTNAITIPNSVTNIGERAFYECAGLTSITIPNNITSIGNYAFMGCINLNSINISCGVTSIGIYAFEDCRSLNSITIPEGITSISEGAFHNCMSLGSVTIPSSVTVINEIAFLDCNNLTEVYCFAEEVPSTSYDAFYVISTGFDDPPIAIESATLHVPAGYVEKYKATSPWSEFGNIVALAEEPVTYTKDQMATIVLPTAPDASKGKYYRLDRVEDKQIVFEQELQPRARVPYIIVPSEDFSIDLSTLDLEGLQADTVSIGGISFIGSYVRKALPQRGSGEGAESFYIDIIDTTPDCTPLPGEEQGERLFIGALRAYLLVNWSDPYNPGGTRSPDDKLEIVLKDFGTGTKDIYDFTQFVNEEIVNGKSSNGKWFDLSGRKIVNSKSSNSKLPRGIYIIDGKKKVSNSLIL